MGGLGCGANLCDKCLHGRDNKHVTATVYAKEQREELEFMKTGQESPRMLAEKGVPLGVPKHLKELLSGDRTGYELMTCYVLEIRHSLMGFFPAIRKGTKIIAIVSEKATIFRIWRSLAPKDSQLLASEYMVNKELGVVYHMKTSDFDQERSRPHKLFSTEEVNALFEAEESPFEWAKGLIGASIPEKEFKVRIEAAARQEGLAA
jgi:hypothetical protein